MPERTANEIEHRWHHHGAECVADRFGIKRGDGEYIVGGTICNREILRLAAEVERLQRAIANVSEGAGGESSMPSERAATLVEVFSQHGDHEPFICGAHGHITAEMVEEIEKDLREGIEDDLCDQGPGSYLFIVRHQEGQYGEEGRCELPPHFELALLKFAPCTPGEPT